MSGCTIHHFKTIDRPLTNEEKQEIDTWSSRFSPTSTEVRYIYHYGSFKKSVNKVFPKYFDALLHVDNYGTKQLMFRFPKDLIDWELVTRFTNIQNEICLDFRKVGDYVIMDLNFWEEEGGDWIEEDDFIVDDYLGIREEILNGDYRSLYLGWLMVQQQVQDYEEEYEEDWEEEEEGLLLPPIPANLQNLTPAQKALIKLFEIDKDLIAAVSSFSPNPSQTTPDYQDLLKLLSPEEKDDYLLRLAKGESRIELKFRQRLDELGGKTKDLDFNQSPSWTTILQRAIALDEENTKQADENERIAHINRMESLILKQPAMWEETAILMLKSNGSAYDKVVKILRELKEVAEYEEKERVFEQKLGEFISPYLRRGAFMRRVQASGIMTIED